MIENTIIWKKEKILGNKAKSAITVLIKIFKENVKAWL